MNYAVIKSGGKQYKVSAGDIIEVEKLQAKPKDKFIFKDVLLFVNDGVVKIGSPSLNNFAVLATVLEQKRAEKLRIAKYKAKVRYRRVNGHRQYVSRVQIETLEAPKSSSEKKVETTKKTTKKSKITA